MKYSISFLFTFIFSFHLGAMVSHAGITVNAYMDSESLNPSRHSVSNRPHQTVDRKTIRRYHLSKSKVRFGKRQMYALRSQFDPKDSYRKSTTRTLLFCFLGLALFVIGLWLSIGLATSMSYLVMILGFGLSIFGFVKCIVLRHQIRGNPDYQSSYDSLGIGLFITGLICAPAAVLGVILGILLFFQPLLDF